MDDFSKGASLHNQDFVGDAEIMLHEVITSKNQTLKTPLVKNGSEKGNGTLVIIADEKSG